MYTDHKNKMCKIKEKIMNYQNYITFHHLSAINGQNDIDILGEHMADGT